MPASPGRLLGQLHPSRRSAAATVCSVLGASSLLAAALGAAALGTAPAFAAGPPLQAVVTYDGAAVSVPGVRVVTGLPSVHAAVVRADGAALVRLAHTRGVRGVAPDDAVQLTGYNDDGAVEPVGAAEGLRGRAGDRDAGRGVRVAVVDTGVSDSGALDRDSGRLVDVADTSAVAEGGPVRTAGRFPDGHGHGTFMASLIAGGPVAGSRDKPVGVAPGATVLVVRVADPDGSTSLSQVVAGLDWVAGHHGQVDVANLSFSHRRPGEAYGADPLTDAVERVRDAGVTVVASAGNVRDELGDPGFDPRVLTVGAADLSGRGRTEVADFSGSGRAAGVPKPDLVANGVHVLGVLPPDSVVARSNPDAHVDGALWRGSGTSQATAITSGAAALLLAAHPDATPAQVKASLREAARPLHGDRDGAGLLKVTTHLRSAPDGTALNGSGEDLTGEGGFDASSWSASSWSASSWSASSWSASSWSASSWSASSWSASSWSEPARGASSWSASSWSGPARGASSWSRAGDGR